jgi:dihydrofolate reductase
MTSIVATVFLSLDGVAEIDPSWHFPYFDAAMGAAVSDDYADVDVLLLGRVTYDSFAGAWPEREAAGEADAAFAKQLGDLRKVVVTRSNPDLGWRNAEPAANLLDRVRELRGEPGVRKVLVAGSISVVRELIEAGELDELRLLIHPVLAGTGRRLFAADAGLRPLRLVKSEVFDTSVVRLIYSPAALPNQDGYERARDNATGSTTD